MSEADLWREIVRLTYAGAEVADLSIMLYDVS